MHSLPNSHELGLLKSYQDSHGQIIAFTGSAACEDPACPSAAIAQEIKQIEGSLERLEIAVMKDGANKIANERASRHMCDKLEALKLQLSFSEPRSLKGAIACLDHAYRFCETIIDFEDVPASDVRAGKRCHFAAMRFLSSISDSVIDDHWERLDPFATVKPLQASEQNDPLLEAIQVYRAGMDDYNANAPADDTADAYVEQSYGPPLETLNQWQEPAQTHEGAIKALELALEEHEQTGVGQEGFVTSMIRATLGYLKEEVKT